MLIVQIYLILFIYFTGVEPYPLYVSVDTGGHTKANAITLYTRYLLAYLTGSKVEDRNRKNCTADSQNQVLNISNFV